MLISFSSSEASSESDEAGEREGGSLVESREKSSIDAASEGEVMISGDGCSGCSVEGVVPLGVSNERRVGRVGVDLDWKPVGVGSGFGGGGAPLPLLWGGIVFK